MRPVEFIKDRRRWRLWFGAAAGAGASILALVTAPIGRAIAVVVVCLLLNGWLLLTQRRGRRFRIDERGITAGDRHVGWSDIAVVTLADIPLRPDENRDRRVRCVLAWPMPGVRLDTEPPGGARPDYVVLASVDELDEPDTVVVRALLEYGGGRFRPTQPTR